MGLFSFKKSLASTGIFDGFVDWHSHILPGVDDGIRSMKSALAVLDYFQQLGVAQVWCTPHIMVDMPNSPADLKVRFEQLKSEYAGPITLHLAAEHMMDSLFERRLAQGDVLPLGEEGDRLLVETSYFNPPADMDGILSRVRSAGFFPVLAHPERYDYMDRKDYERLSAEGVLLQMNVASLVGAYGPHVQVKAQWMLDRDMYSYYGSDIHSLESFKERINIKAKFKL